MALFTHAALAVYIPTPDPGVYRWWFTEDDAKKFSHEPLRSLQVAYKPEALRLGSE